MSTATFILFAYSLVLSIAASIINYRELRRIKEYERAVDAQCDKAIEILREAEDALERGSKAIIENYINESHQL